MDRYKKLEDSKFKRKFLDNITGSMEENLVASLQSNMVWFCLEYIKKSIIVIMKFIMFRDFEMMKQIMHF